MEVAITNTYLPLFVLINVSKERMIARQGISDIGRPDQLGRIPSANRIGPVKNSPDSRTQAETPASFLRLTLFYWRRYIHTTNLMS